MEYGKYMLNTSMLHYNGTEENGVGGGIHKSVISNM